MDNDKKPTDVLIFEDDKTEVARIVEWLDLERYTVVASSLFQKMGTANGDEDQLAESAFRKLIREITSFSPRLVIMDYLLGGQSGNMIYDGAYYGNRCKEVWPHLGVILVTTGGPNIASQKELDAQKAIWQETAANQANAEPPTRKNDAIVDFAWIKDWGSATDSLPRDYVRQAVDDLITKKCLRPSEQSAPVDY